MGHVVKSSNASEPSTYSWTSKNLGFCPSDSDINAKSWAFTDTSGTVNANPFYRASTPDDPTQTLAVTNSNLGSSAGVAASDGTYVYVRNRQGQSGGPTKWQKFNGSTGAYVAAVPNTNFSSSTPAWPLTAFYFNTYLYSGTTSVSGGYAYLTGHNKDTGATHSLKFDTPPLDRDTAGNVSTTAASYNILLGAYDNKLYSVAHTRTSASGTPNYDGYKIREYNLTGNGGSTNDTTTLVGTTTLNTPSMKVSGVVVDAKSIYLIGWTADATATITRVSRSAMEIVGQWRIDQSSTGKSAGAGTGAYISGAGSADVIWLGALNQGKLYRYAGPGNGLELRDNPNPMYIKTGGTESTKWTHYVFRVVPYTSIETDPTPYWGTAVTLDNRTRHFKDLPKHTSYDLGTFVDHRAVAVLDAKRLEVSTTDLDIASWGPRAELDRQYSSTRFGTTLFAPGWRFGFERELTESAGLATYRDDLNDGIVFRQLANGTWMAPTGFYATLASDTTQSPAGWTMTMTKDRSTITFDSTGELIKETDANGNVVTYVWANGKVSQIKAANDETIDLQYDASGAMTTATYQTTAGKRIVTYAKLAGDTWEATFFAPDPAAPTVHFAEEYKIRYTYDSTDPSVGKLTAVQLFEHNGSWVYPTDPTRREEFTYGSYGQTPNNDFNVAALPDYFSSNNGVSALVQISYADPTATVTRYGQADVVDEDGVVTPVDSTSLMSVYTWNENGTLASRTDPPMRDHGATPAPKLPYLADTWTYQYGPDNTEVSITSPLGNTKRMLIDSRGNLLAKPDAQGHGPVYVYDYAATFPDLPKYKIDASGATTLYTYDNAYTYPSGLQNRGNLLAEETEMLGTPMLRDVSSPPSTSTFSWTPDVTTTSRTEYTYSDALFGGQFYVLRGALTQQRVKLSLDTANGNAPVWATTVFAKYLRCGKPKYVRYLDIVRDYAAPTDVVTLEVDTDYDEFGNPTQKTKLHLSSINDGPWVETNTFDLAGRLLTSQGPTSTTHPERGALIAHHTNDAMGNEVASWTSTTGATTPANAVTNYVTRTFTGSGLVDHEYYRDGNAGLNGSVLRTVSHTYDGSGREVHRHDNSLGGAAATIEYDTRGHMIRSWADCAAGSELQRATRSRYDADGRLIETQKPGGDPRDGSPAGGMRTSYTYNGDGTVQREDCLDGSFKVFTYDTAGRVLTEATPLPSWDAASKKYDLAWRKNEYDLLGHLLRETDAGMLDTTYKVDLGGRRIYESRLIPEPMEDGSLEDSNMTTTYNALGWNLREQAVNDTSTSTIYDNGGRVTKKTVGSEVTRFAYDDPLDRVDTKKRENTSGVVCRQVTYDYDTLGRVASEHDTIPGNSAATNRDQWIVYGYDSHDRVIHLQEYRGASKELLVEDVTSQYPTDGAPGTTTATAQYGVATSPTDPDGPVSVPIVEVSTWDGSGHDQSYVTRLSDNTQLFDRRVVTHDYADRNVWITLDATPTVTTDALMTSGFYYSDVDRLTRQWGTGWSYAGSNKDSAPQSYFYDRLTGRQTHDLLHLDSVGGDVDITYSYHKDGKLKKANDTEYAYNGAGGINKITVSGDVHHTFTYTTKNRLSKHVDNGTTTVFKWDTNSNGRRVSQGASDSSQTTTYTYTDAGELKSYINSVADTRADYEYDGTGQRVQSVISTNTDSSADKRTTTTDYVYDGTLLLALNAIQRDNSGNVTARWAISYLYDENSRPYAGVYRNGAGETYPFAIVTTKRGDVVELLDKKGNMFATYRYHVWGEPLSIDTQATANIPSDPAWGIGTRQPLRYAGYAYDSGIGLYYLSARYYDPDSCQFISRDPARWNGQESPYQYVDDQPVNNTDPTGLYKTLVDRMLLSWEEQVAIRQTGESDAATAYEFASVKQVNYGSAYTSEMFAGDYNQYMIQSGRNGDEARTLEVRLAVPGGSELETSRPRTIAGHPAQQAHLRDDPERPTDPSDHGADIPRDPRTAALLRDSCVPVRAHAFEQAKRLGRSSPSERLALDRRRSRDLRSEGHVQVRVHQVPSSPGTAVRPTAAPTPRATPGVGATVAVDGDAGAATRTISGSPSSTVTTPVGQHRRLR